MKVLQKKTEKPTKRFWNINNIISKKFVVHNVYEYSGIWKLCAKCRVRLNSIENNLIPSSVRSCSIVKNPSPNSKAQSRNSKYYVSVLVYQVKISIDYSICYLGSKISTTGGSAEITANSLNRARGAFILLNIIWSSKSISSAPNSVFLTSVWKQYSYTLANPGSKQKRW